MSKKVYRQDDKYIIEDENGIKRSIKYNDNLEEILIQENLVNGLRDREKVLLSYVDEYKKRIESTSKIGKNVVNINLLTSIALLISSILVLARADTTAVENCIAPISILCALNCSNYYFVNKKKYQNNKLQGVEFELEYLKQIIEEEKEKLYSLNMKYSNSKENEENFKEFNITDEKVEEKYKELELFNFIGANIDELIKYYQNNKDNFIIDDLSKEELEIVREYLKEYLNETKNTNVRTRKKDL